MGADMTQKRLSSPGVVVLYNESQTLIKGEPEDMLAENEVIECAALIAKALSPHYKVVQVPVRTEVELALAPYPPTKWMVFNLAEGLDGKLFEGARIAWALEAMGYCFTGSGGDSLAYSTHKAITKKMLQQVHIPTPRGWVFRHSCEIDGGVEFPVIVKPVAEDGSLGIWDEAVAHNKKALSTKVDYILERYCQLALVEEFIPGREFNIAVWGNPPEVLPLYEIDFSDFSNPQEQIVSYAAKWMEDSFAYHHTPGICPASVDKHLGDEIRKVALGAFQALKCKGYARVDIRVSNENIPYVIEVNCNPDLAPEAGFARATQTAGYSYQDMILHILDIAEKEYLPIC